MKLAVQTALAQVCSSSSIIGPDSGLQGESCPHSSGRRGGDVPTAAGAGNWAVPPGVRRPGDPASGSPYRPIYAQVDASLGFLDSTGSRTAYATPPARLSRAGGTSRPFR